MSWSRACLDESPAQRKAKRVAQTQRWRSSNPDKLEAYKARRAEIDRLRKLKPRPHTRGPEPELEPIIDTTPKPVTLPTVLWLLRTTHKNTLCN